MTNNFSLGNQLYCTMLNKLQNIRGPVWAVQHNISLLLVYKSLVTQSFVIFPGLNKILYHTYI